MRKTLCQRLPWLLAVGLCLSLSLSSAAPLAVPKAAEHADDEVTFGEAVGAPPKPANKMIPPKKTVTSARAAGKPVAGKETGSAKPRPAGKSPAKAMPAKKTGAEPRKKAARK